MWSAILLVKGTEKKKKATEKKASAACSIYITCSDPGADGKMQVEMSYEGDKILASYLLESAQQMFLE